MISLLISTILSKPSLKVKGNAGKKSGLDFKYKKNETKVKLKGKFKNGKPKVSHFAQTVTESETEAYSKIKIEEF